MIRQIYEVYAKVVDANGAYNTLSGYPKTFDSRSYSGDLDKTLKRAKAEYLDTLSALLKRDDRQLQTVMLMSADGRQIMRESIGAIAPDPDPEPETPEEEPEVPEE